jgi:FixJ family two-component response regulator
MPGTDGQGVLKALASRKAVVIMLTGYGNIEAAVEAMRLGAENFLTKPVEMTHLVQIVEKASEKEALRRETVALRARLAPTPRRRLLRAAVLAVIVFIALVLGTAIGRMGGQDDAPASSPIPIDSTLG